jgi:hypothetical protein
MPDPNYDSEFKKDSDTVRNSDSHPFDHSGTNVAGGSVTARVTVAAQSRRPPAGDSLPVAGQSPCHVTAESRQPPRHWHCGTGNAARASLCCVPQTQPVPRPLAWPRPGLTVGHGLRSECGPLARCLQVQLELGKAHRAGSLTVRPGPGATVPLYRPQRTGMPAWQWSL